VSWFLALAGFASLVIFHEAGHFVAAKAVGMRVERFSLFFGKPVVSVTRGETEYGIGWAPLGGYVKITGMNPNEELDPAVAPRAYYRQAVWKRIVVISAGPAVNFVLAFLILWFVQSAHGPLKQTDTVDVITRGAPAAQVLQTGDRIVAVDGKRGDPATLREQIGTHRCAGRPVDGCKATTPATLTVVRDGRTITLTVTPRYDGEAKRPLIGFQFGADNDPLSVGAGARESVDDMWTVTTATVKTLGKLFYDKQARDEVSGVVGSYEATRQSFEFNSWQALQILGLISLSLAVVNLLPFLPLDGGHIFWALAEKVRGRAIPFSVMERASVVGIFLVLLLAFIGLQNDVERISNGELSRQVR
jgi:regulator of sigma E protease